MEVVKVWNLRPLLLWGASMLNEDDRTQLELDLERNGRGDEEGTNEGSKGRKSSRIKSKGSTIGGPRYDFTWVEWPGGITSPPSRLVRRSLMPMFCHLSIASCHNIFHSVPSS